MQRQGREKERERERQRKKETDREREEGIKNAYSRIKAHHVIPPLLSSHCGLIKRL